MNVKEIGKLAIGLLNKDISQPLITTLINSAVYYIVTMLDCKTVLKQNEILLTATTNALRVVLPSNCISVLEVSKQDGSTYFPYTYYTISKGYITFGNDGQYNVQYTTMPNNVMLETDIPDVHELYHRVLSEYIMYKVEERVNTTLSSTCLQTFITTCKQIDSQLQQQQQYSNNIPVGDFY